MWISYCSGDMHEKREERFDVSKLEMATEELQLTQVRSMISFIEKPNKFAELMLIIVCYWRFRAKLLLEKLRNKRLMFVGDSLNRNQWESMVCLAQSIIPPGRKSVNKTGSLSIFRIEVSFFSYFVLVFLKVIMHSKLVIFAQQVIL